MKTWAWDDAWSAALLVFMSLCTVYAVLAAVQILAAALYLLFAEVGAVWLAVTHSRRRNRRAR